MLRKLTDNKWFSLANLIVIIISGLVWVTKPEVGGLLLIVIFIPWVLRILAGVSPIQQTGYDWLLAVFLITAVVGYWAAYDKVAAWSKLWLIIGSVLLFYALSAQPEKSLSAVANLSLGLAVGISIFFFLTHNFDNGSMNNIASWWMRVRPQTNWQAVHSSYITGAISITGLFGLYRFVDNKEKKAGSLAALWNIFAYFGLGIVSLTFLLAMSRGIWVVSLSALALWIIWKVLGLSVFNSGNVQNSSFPIIVILFLSIVILIVHFGLSNTGAGFLSLLRYGTNTRAELFGRGVSLLMDFPITGGGLSSFPGLYSNYILGIPYFYFANSYNLFLDIAIEQGVFGGLVISFLYLASVWNSSLVIVKANRVQNKALGWLALFMLVISIIHGMMYDYLYNGVGTLLLLFPVGISVVGLRYVSQETVDQTPLDLFSPREKNHRTLIALAMAGIIVAGSWLFAMDKVKSVWYSNLGAVHMAQVELGGFPQKGWPDSTIIPKLETVEDPFLSSLQFDPQNLTANYRLGLIFMLRRDFEPALIYLDEAYEKQPNHRGIIKSLGYCYVWLGKYDKARFLLEQIPEAPEELSVYIWWWGTQGRNDLSEKASTMLSKFEISSIQP